MKVRDLIAFLSGYDMESEVLVDIGEGSKYFLSIVDVKELQSQENVIEPVLIIQSEEDAALEFEEE